MREALAMPPRCIKQASTRYPDILKHAAHARLTLARSVQVHAGQPRGFSRVCVFRLQKGSL